MSSKKPVGNGFCNFPSLGNIFILHSLKDVFPGYRIFKVVFFFPPPVPSYFSFQSGPPVRCLLIPQVPESLGILFQSFPLVFKNWFISVGFTSNSDFSPCIFSILQLILGSFLFQLIVFFSSEIPFRFSFCRFCFSTENLSFDLFQCVSAVALLLTHTNIVIVSALSLCLIVQHLGHLSTDIC